MTDEIDPIAGALAPAAAEEPKEGGDWQLMDLRERGRLDPLQGSPLRIPDVGEVEPGEWQAQGLADRWTGLPPLCPIVPLGRDADASVVLNAMGDVHRLKDSSSGKGPIGGAFAGRSRYLEWAWPRRDKKGRVAGWEADDARQAIVDACAYMGPYDPDRLHGRGAWQDDAHQLVYHAGDRVYVEGVWREPGRHGSWIYPARPRMGAPWPTPIEGGRHGPVELLREVFETWNWRRKQIDPHLLVGWACMAMIGGALSWRSMVFVTAEYGSGKSTLLELLRQLFGHGLLKTGNTTGAYLYQKLGHDSIPVVIDELEAKPANDPASPQKVIELIRMASSGDKIGRGSSDGVAKEFECRSAFICTSINIPTLRQQDMSRFAILNLDRFAEATADPAIPWKLIGDTGRQLLRRMIDGWPRWHRTLLAFKRALIDHGRHDARGAEQFGALLAAAHIAEHDHDPTAEELETWAVRLKAADLGETANKTDDWRECLMHLCDVTPEALRNKANAYPTLGSRIAAFRHKPNTFGDLKAICTMMGLTVSVPKGDLPTWENTRLFIPCNHPETRKNFAGTSWEGAPGAVGVWHMTLQRAPRAMIWRDVCGAGLDKKRNGVFVQLAAAFPDVGEEEDQREDEAA